MSKIYLVSLVIITCYIALPLHSAGQYTLDPSFGNAGKVITIINDSNSSAYCIAVKPNGKIVAGGSSTILGEPQFTLVQYNEDGTPDSSFAVNGIGIFSLDIRSRAQSIAIQPDGKIVAAGLMIPGSDIYRYRVIRLNTDGTIDSSFGTNGIATAVSSGYYADIKKIIIRSNGKILAAGSVALPIMQDAPSLIQFNPDGSLDSSFGTNGVWEQYIPDIYRLNDIAITANGSVYASAGNSNYDGAFNLVKFHPHGMLDSSFGINGVVRSDVVASIYGAEESSAITIMADGSILQSGWVFANQLSNFCMVRYHPDGNLFTTFGSNGIVITPINGYTAQSRGVLEMPNGNIVLSGNTFNTHEDMVLVQYLPSGTLDPGFGVNGIITTDMLGNKDECYAASLQPDGKILIAGSASDGSKSNLALARYFNAPVPLKLVNFIAYREGKNNRLEWNTSNEVNLALFEVERSANGIEFNYIGNVQPGYSTYRFIDNHPIKGLNYYRLKIIDLDGRFIYSPVQRTDLILSDIIRTYPNPVGNHLTIEIETASKKTVDIAVINQAGKVVANYSKNLETGLNTFTINTNSLPKGAYHLRTVNANGDIQTIRFIKQ